MKPLSLEETKLKEEMKERCLNKGQYVDENAKTKFDMLCHLEDFEVAYWELENQQKEFIEYLENEKDRLARECSQIYEDSLGKTRFVNEDIFNEVDKNLAKYKEIIGVSDENNKQ